jgi:hypothetical protein
MYEYWSNLSFTTRFSIIACVVTVPLGLLSMGLLGAVLYYPVSIFFPNYPRPTRFFVQKKEVGRNQGPPKRPFLSLYLLFSACG